MSGSSFEYLCHKEEERLFTSHTLYWMKAMYRQLFQMGFNDVAWDTKKLRIKIKEGMKRLEEKINNHEALKDMFAHMMIEEFLESSNQNYLEQISQGYIDDNEWDKGSHYIVLRELSKKLLTEVQKEKDLLEDVWYAVEWYCSGDTGIEAVEKAVKYYKEDKAEKQPKTPLQLMQERELESKIYKHAVREFVDEETYQKINNLYNQKITEARKLGLNKTNLPDLFPNKERKR